MPEYGGLNALGVAGEKHESSEKWFPAIKKGKLYLLDSAKDRDTWLADDGKLVAAADTKWSTEDNLVLGTATSLGQAILTLGPVPMNSAVETARLGLPVDDRRVAEARKAGGSAKDLGEALGSRAWAYLLLNRPDDAMRDIEEALRLAPDLDWVRVNMADTLLVRGKFDEAMAIYRTLADKQRVGGEELLCVDIRDDAAQLLHEGLVRPSLAKRVVDEVRCATSRHD
jgi:tetratricopeptide (TPR) repeat protein